MKNRMYVNVADPSFDLVKSTITNLDKDKPNAWVAGHISACLKLGKFKDNDTKNTNIHHVVTVLENIYRKRHIYPFKDFSFNSICHYVASKTGIHLAEMRCILSFDKAYYSDTLSFVYPRPHHHLNQVQKPPVNTSRHSVRPALF